VSTVYLTVITQDLWTAGGEWYPTTRVWISRFYGGND